MDEKKDYEIEDFEQAEKLIKDGSVEAKPEQLAKWIAVSRSGKIPEGNKLDMVDLLLLD